jgi:Ca2+-binding RTX toxin-like protein
MATFTGTVGADAFTGTKFADTFTSGGGGDDSFFGGKGDDEFFFGSPSADLTGLDTIDGGLGLDILHVTSDHVGPAAVTFSPTTMTGVETILCDPAFAYELILDDGNVAAGETLKVDNSAGLLGAGGLTVHGEDETDGRFVLLGGAGGDHLVGGALKDKIFGGADTTGNMLVGMGGKDAIKGSAGPDGIIGGFGADNITPGGGADVLLYMVPPDSSGPSYDIIKGFDFATMDKFDMPGPVFGVAPPIPAGTLSKATFEADMMAAVPAPALPPLHAVLFFPSLGTLAGKTFLVVDGNGVAGYQPGGGMDYVMQLKAPVSLGALDSTDFI